MATAIYQKNMILLITCNIFAMCSALGLYKSLNLATKTTQLFDRLQYYEIIKITQNEFNDIGHDNEYPNNGILEFNALGNHYKVLIEKDSSLFSDTFFTETRTFNEKTQSIDKQRSTQKPQCYYTAKVLSDTLLHSTNGVLSVCNDRGVRGWIHAFGETIVIRPKLYLTDVTYKGPHNIHDDHIVYEYSDLDKTDIQFSDNDIAETFINPKEEQEHVHPSNKRRMQDKTRYVELAIVNDPAMMIEYDLDYDTILDKTISIVSMTRSVYLNTDWGAVVGEIQIVLSAVYFIESWDAEYVPDTAIEGNCTSTIPSVYGTESNSFCEVDYNDYLYKFIDFRTNEMEDSDIAHLFSFYDFKDSVFGYSSLPGVCSITWNTGYNTGGIDQVTYDDESNAFILAHELGHGFDMSHDSIGNPCDVEKYIMAAKGGGPNSSISTTFSSCSKQYMTKFFEDYPTELSCLDNEPSDNIYSNCYDANGTFIGCDNDDICCHNCMAIPANSSVCRAATGVCDIAEYCDGVSSTCPTDLKYVEGTQCSSGASFGYCYQSDCVSIEQQCEDYGPAYGLSDTCHSPEWQVTNCASELECYNSGTTECAKSFNNPDDGTPCNVGDSSPAQCVDGECRYSSSIYTYIWLSSSWSACDNCFQTRDIQCMLLDGTIVNNNSLCVDKPDDMRSCNCTTTTKSEGEGGDTGDGIKLEIDTSSLFFKALLVVGVIAVLLIIYCVLYIFCFSGLLQRTQQPGTQGFFKTIRIAGCCHFIALMLGVFDIATDYLYAVDLITQTNDDIQLLGWASLFSAIVGLILFGTKILLTSKLVGYQQFNLKKQLAKYASKSSEAQVIMNQIRQRSTDLDVIGLLISCLEDIPQATIVVIVIHSNYEWNAVSIANFSLSVISFLWKSVQVFASRFGCKDPSVDFASSTRNIEMELAENTQKDQRQNPAAAPTYV